MQNFSIHQFAISVSFFKRIIWKVQQKNSLLKLHTTKRERALGALNGTLLCISLSASHKIFCKIGLLKNVILIFQNIKKNLTNNIFASPWDTLYYDFNHIFTPGYA